MKQNKPVSAEMFDDLYMKMAIKISETTDTIFEGIDLSSDCDKNYREFIQNKAYYDSFVEESSIYEKNKIIKMFIENEILSTIYTSVYDTMLIESDSMELSFKQQMLTENTETDLNVTYLGTDNTQYNKDIDILEESGIDFSDMMAGLKKRGSTVLNVIPNAIKRILIKKTAKAAFGENILQSVKLSRQADEMISDLYGSAGLALVNFKSGLGNNYNSRQGRSQENLITFDNIDIHPDVQKIFKEMTQSGGKSVKGVSALSNLVEQCVFDSKLLENDLIDKGQIGYFEGEYDPRKGNYLKAIKDEFFKEANSDSGLSGQIIQFRKCLITKLIDLYKFLMIVAISESQEYKKIIKIMHKGFTEDYVNLLGFMPEGNEQEIETKAKLMQLVQLRMVYNNLSKDLSKGAFDIDKDAGKFFNEKLKQVDTEIEQELHNRSRKIDVLHETQADNSQREIKGAKLTEREQKRSHFLDK